MLKKVGSGFELYPYKVKYTQRGEEIEQWALPSTEWWDDFASKWNHTEIVQFTEITITPEQQARFDEINELGISEGFEDVLVDYILNGFFPEDIKHPLRDLQIKKEKEELTGVIDDLVSVLVAKGVVY